MFINLLEEFPNYIIQTIVYLNLIFTECHRTSLSYKATRATTRVVTCKCIINNNTFTKLSKNRQLKKFDTLTTKSIQ